MGHELEDEEDGYFLAHNGLPNDSLRSQDGKLEVPTLVELVDVGDPQD